MFGNPNRFTDELGGSTYANDIVIDWTTYDVDAGTVLGFRRTQNGVDINWNDAIDGAQLVSIGSFNSGWRLPNAKEISNLFCWDEVSLSLNGFPLSYTPIYPSIATFGSLWTSTTLPAATTQAMRANTNHRIDYVAKTTVAPMRYIPFRLFTVSGTTLT